MHRPMQLIHSQPHRQWNRGRSFKIFCHRTVLPWRQKV